MFRWPRRTLFALLGATLALGALSACSHRHDAHAWSQATPEQRAKFREKVLDRATSKLDLDAQQRQRLGVLLDKVAEQRTALLGATDPRAEIRGFVAGEKFDRAKAQAFVTQKTGAVAEKSPEVVAALGDFYDSLRPAQQAKVREFMERRRHWRS